MVNVLMDAMVELFLINYPTKVVLFKAILELKFNICG
jgi:hypothetical protein